jgi:Zn-dependent protease
LPETHNCTNIGHFATDTYRKQKLAKTRLPRNATTVGDISYKESRYGSRFNFWSSGEKNKDVLYAGMLFGLVSILFFLRSGLTEFFFLLPFSVVYGIFGMFTIYLIRERTCSQYNLSTRFLFWPIGIAITVIFGVIGSLWILIGYFFIEGEASSRSYGIVGIVSTFTAVGLFFISYFLVEFSPFGYLFILTGGKFLFVALLNMLPLWGLDGQRLYEWQPRYYWIMLIVMILLVAIFNEFVFRGIF